MVAKWDPHTHPIIAEAGGTAKFVNMDQGITVRTQTDELTGLSTMEVIDSKERPAAGKDIRPAIQLIDEKGEEVQLPGGGTAIFFLPANALVTMANGARIELGDVVAVSRRKAPRPATSPVVCHGLPTCSRPVVRRSRPFWPKSAVWCRSARKPKARSAW